MSLLIVDTILVYSYIYKLQLVTVSLTQSLIAIHYRIDTLSDTLKTQLIQSYRNLKKGKSVLLLVLRTACYIRKSCH